MVLMVKARVLVAAEVDEGEGPGDHRHEHHVDRELPRAGAHSERFGPIMTRHRQAHLLAGTQRLHPRRDHHLAHREPVGDR
jgi:hypothetical protein